VTDSTNICYRLREAAKTMRKHSAASLEARELDEAADIIEKLRAQNDAQGCSIVTLRREAADKQYMLDAIIPMLGPKGQEVVQMWHDKGVKRIHVDWGPEGIKTSGEERAQLHLDFEEAMKTAVPVDNIDGDTPQREVSEFIEEIKNRDS